MTPDEMKRRFDQLDQTLREMSASNRERFDSLDVSIDGCEIAGVKGLKTRVMQIEWTDRERLKAEARRSKWFYLALASICGLVVDAAKRYIFGDHK